MLCAILLVCRQSGSRRHAHLAPVMQPVAIALRRFSKHHCILYYMWTALERCRCRCLRSHNHSCAHPYAGGSTRVEVFTDHKPFSQRCPDPFDSIPVRVQRWLLALLPFDFLLSFTPGSTMCITYALSRAPLTSTDATPAKDRPMREFVGLVLTEPPVSEENLRIATADDTLLSSIVRRTVSGYWTNVTTTEEPYFLIPHNLTVLDGIFMMDNRSVVPSALQLPILRLSHEGHPGLNVCQDSLRRLVWWPHLSRDASRFAASCDRCWQNKTSGNQ